MRIAHTSCQLIQIQRTFRSMARHFQCGEETVASYDAGVLRMYVIMEPIFGCGDWLVDQ